MPHDHRLDRYNTRLEGYYKRVAGMLHEAFPPSIGAEIHSNSVLLFKDARQIYDDVNPDYKEARKHIIDCAREKNIPLIIQGNSIRVDNADLDIQETAFLSILEDCMHAHFTQNDGKNGEKFSRNVVENTFMDTRKQLLEMQSYRRSKAIDNHRNDITPPVPGTYAR